MGSLAAAHLGGCTVKDGLLYTGTLDGRIVLRFVHPLRVTTLHHIWGTARQWSPPALPITCTPLTRTL